MYPCKVILSTLYRATMNTIGYPAGYTASERPVIATSPIALIAPIAPTSILPPCAIARGGARAAGGGVMSSSADSHDPSGPSGHLPNCVGEEREVASANCGNAPIAKPVENTASESTVIATSPIALIAPMPGARLPARHEVTPPAHIAQIAQIPQRIENTSSE